MNMSIPIFLLNIYMITIPTNKNTSLKDVIKNIESTKQDLDIVLIAAPVHELSHTNFKNEDILPAGDPSSWPIAGIAAAGLKFKPAAGIFYLKGMLNKHNFSSLCLELNLHLEQHFENSIQYDKIYKSLLNESYTPITSIAEEKITKFIEKKIKISELTKKLNIHEKVIPFLKQYIDEKVKIHNPKFVGISVFSIHSQKITIALCTLLREQLPETTIILGGCGLGQEIGSERTFGKTLLKYKLADFYISGDGEISLIELLVKSNNTSFLFFCIN